MADPRVPQGNINRLRASVVFASAPEFNITPPYLGREGISISFDGAATGRIPTMTGQVNSPEPYQPVMLSVDLLKTQDLAAQYEARRQFNTLMGDCTVRPDVASGSGLIPYQFINMSIENVGELRMNGSTAAYGVTLGGYMIINSALWGGG